MPAGIRNPGSLYPDHIVGIGLTEEGQPAVVYASCAGSEGCGELVKGREWPYSSNVFRENAMSMVLPAGETAGQRRGHAYLPVVKIGWEERREDDDLGRYAVVGNGAHTVRMHGHLTDGFFARKLRRAEFNKHTDTDGVLSEAISENLARCNREHACCVPGVIGLSSPRLGNDYLGIIDSDGDTRIMKFGRKEGMFRCVPVYSEESGECAMEETVGMASIPGRTAGELAEEMYGRIGRYTAACTGAARFTDDRRGWLYRNGIWELAVRNSSECRSSTS
jgi:hypothetical protein